MTYANEIITAVKRANDTRNCSHCIFDFNECNLMDDKCFYGAVSSLLESQQKEIEQLKQQVPKWISVEERLPDKLCEDGRLYNIHPLLVTLTNGAVCEAWWNGFDFKTPPCIVCHGWAKVYSEFNPVTHWMPLPKGLGELK